MKHSLPLVLDKSAILFENDFFLVINKPSGTLSHLNHEGHKGDSVADFIRPYINFAKDDLRAGIVHRLDKDTSGVLLCAKTPLALHRFQELFKSRNVEKTYEALVYGRLYEGEGEMLTGLTRDTKNRNKQRIEPLTTEDLPYFYQRKLSAFPVPSKLDEENSELFPKGGPDETQVLTGIKARKALTYYKVLQYFSQTTLVQLRPVTGRTHQLRVQLQHLGFPVVGDKLYAGKFKDKKFVFIEEDWGNIPLFLLAKKLEFVDPFSGENCVFEVPRPSFFAKALAILDKE